jgi:hypothetical protein
VHTEEEIRALISRFFRTCQSSEGHRSSQPAETRCGNCISREMRDRPENLDGSHVRAVRRPPAESGNATRAIKRYQQHVDLFHFSSNVHLLNHIRFVHDSLSSTGPEAFSVHQNPQRSKLTITFSVPNSPYRFRCILAHIPNWYQ